MHPSDLSSIPIVSIAYNSEKTIGAINRFPKDANASYA